MPEPIMLDRRRLGRSDLRVTPLCVGGGPIGSMPGNFGYETPVERGIETALAAMDGPINFLDTSNGYSGGESERRIGAAIVRNGGLPDEFVLATKLDRDLDSGDFGAERMYRSARESQERLGLETFHLLHLHDPEHVGFDAAMAPGGPVEALLALKERGVARYIGVAGGPVDMLRRFVATGVFDVVLTHNRWSLVDRSADELIQEAFDAGVGVLNAAVFGGGVLARGLVSGARYAYRDAEPRVVAAIAAIEELARSFEVPLPAAAIQFSTRDPRIASTVLGVSHPERVGGSVALNALPIPEEFWARVQDLAAPSDTWLW
ncbi:aldo/keto reductase [Occultella aeris]|uniref:D-threo-aldose 1-dehydrogenase n=1 Tax=Occultella aeris TaxID=2761496 RepID=A0A7M4DSA0_9MICO|nr:aldo/keto reductase [Occultella aeris]VZO40344.1 D-threo-aldose 1-dehydrogenase [Occultella aeris]